MEAKAFETQIIGFYAEYCSLNGIWNQTPYLRVLHLNPYRESLSKSLSDLGYPKIKGLVIMGPVTTF